jgi:YidC/Oxa1 family membrane protein insertase
MEFIWDEFLYKPLFNLLIFLYQYKDVFSLGLAVIYLTIILRIVLLPFTFFAQRNKVRYEMLSKEIRKISEDYKHDPEQAKQEARDAMKRYKIRPWAKAVVLSVQALVLVLLYQVFLGGINNKFDDLYVSVPSPDFINLTFWGINLGERNFYLALFIGVVLFVEIAYNQKLQKNLLSESDAFFKYLFPISSVVVLAMLPAVKSVFILTSILFTVIVSIILRLFIKPLKKK